MRRLDAYKEWINSAYDEDGSEAVCDCCGEPLHWNKTGNLYFCSNCGREFNRSVFFAYIGAQPPGDTCFSCQSNYPFCRRNCPHYHIDTGDLLL